MEVVRKDYYQPQELQQQQLQQPKKKTKKSYRLEKVVAGLSISVFLFLGIFLLLRYAAITESKHQVIKLNNQLEQMVNQKEKLKLELEKATKSKLIEMEAMSRLNMTYPKADQTYYITINPTKVALLTNEMNKQLALSDEGANANSEGVMSKVLSKFVGLFKI